MIILHNRHDESSRQFVEQFGEGHYVLDWYSEEDQQAWIAAGGTLQVQGFPAVIVETPEVVIPADGDRPETKIPGGQVALGCLESMADLGTRVKKLNDVIRLGDKKPELVNINKHAVDLPDKVIRRKVEEVRQGRGELERA